MKAKTLDEEGQKAVAQMVEKQVGQTGTQTSFRPLRG